MSPLLFSIMINYVFEDLDNGLGLSLFADDGAIWKRGRNIGCIVKKLQEAIATVEEWSYKWGFKFSVDKTKIMFFTRKKIGSEVKINLYNQELERVKHFTFLGIWFDERVTWVVHIQNIVNKCKKIINTMRCLVGSEWGADRMALKAMYSGLVRSVLDYGCVVYGSAAETSLRKLDNIQHQVLRLCTGAIKTTPITALQVEMGEMSLEMRRVQLSVNYWVNLQGHSQEHPTLDTLKPCWEKERKKMKSFGWTVIQKATELKVNQFNVSPTVPLPVIKPWLDFTLLEQKIKGNEYNLYNVQKYINEYYSYVQIYTDASKSLDNKIGVAFTVPEFHLSVRKRTSEELSVYTGEMIALLLAIRWIEEIRPLKSVICSDSCASLASLLYSHSESRPDILMGIMQTLYRIQMMGITVVFLWVPAHIGIQGNETADKKQKQQ